MATGCCNIYTSRRTNFEECLYWKRDDQDKDLETYTHENKSSGRFFAKEISPLAKKKLVIGGVFMFDSKTIMLETNDSVEINAGDIVKYENKLWNVSDVQELEFHKNSQFMKKVDYKTYISLRG